MANINLLPWREELRQKRQRDFISILVGVLVLSAIVVAAWYAFNEKLIENQKNRNRYLKQEIVLVDKKIKEIKEIEERKANLIARMEVIQKLQISRPLIVHLFDELVRILPDGVVIDTLKQTNDAIIVEGFAQSNARVSALMRNIDQSKWLGSEVLKVIDFIDTKQRQGQIVQDKKGRASFTLKFKQIPPKVNKGDIL